MSIIDINPMGPLVRRRVSCSQNKMLRKIFMVTPLLRRVANVPSVSRSLWSEDNLVAFRRKRSSPVAIIGLTLTVSIAHSQIMESFMNPPPFCIHAKIPNLLGVVWLKMTFVLFLFNLVMFNLIVISYTFIDI